MFCFGGCCRFRGFHLIGEISELFKVFVSAWKAKASSYFRLCMIYGFHYCSLQNACLDVNREMYMPWNLNEYFGLIFRPLVSMVAQGNCCVHKCDGSGEENEEEKSDTKAFWALAVS